MLAIVAIIAIASFRAAYKDPSTDPSETAKPRVSVSATVSPR